MNQDVKERKSSKKRYQTLIKRNEGNDQPNFSYGRIKSKTTVGGEDKNLYTRKGKKRDTFEVKHRRVHMGAEKFLDSLTSQNLIKYQNFF